MCSYPAKTRYRLPKYARLEEEQFAGIGTLRCLCVDEPRPCTESIMRLSKRVHADFVCLKHDEDNEISYWLYNISKPKGIDFEAVCHATDCGEVDEYADDFSAMRILRRGSIPFSWSYYIRCCEV